MAKQIILIIGGPGTGKTTLINALTEKGYSCYPEISREVTLQAREKGIEYLFLEDPLLFSEMLLQGRIGQFEAAVADEAPAVFIDRGIPDVVAYMDYIGDTYPEHFTAACQQYRYDHIFVLPPWEEIYQSDETRYEDYEQAKIIYQHLLATYAKYGYEMTEVPKDTVENRLAFMTAQLSQVF